MTSDIVRRVRIFSCDAIREIALTVEIDTTILLLGLSSYKSLYSFFRLSVVHESIYKSYLSHGSMAWHRMSKVTAAVWAWLGCRLTNRS